MTWKSVNKVLATLGVLGTLAVVSGADFLDGFAMSLTSFAAPATTAVTTTVTTVTHHHR